MRRGASPGTFAAAALRHRVGPWCGLLTPSSPARTMTAPMKVTILTCAEASRPLVQALVKAGAER
jgi:hypothetical protein